MYDSIETLCVRGVFLLQLTEELDNVGRTRFLDDPHGTLWAILDRANVEVGKVIHEKINQLEESKVITDAITRASCDNDEDKKSTNMAKLLICLKAVLLLLARYHPELHRVTPIYTLCDILRKGVSTMSEVTIDAKRYKEQDDLFSWINMILEILQLRLSGPISRGDWGDFVSAGGADALCMILTSPLETWGIHIRKSDDSSTGDLVSKEKNDKQSAVLKEMIACDESSRKENEVENIEKVIETQKTLELAAQLLQNLVFSSCSQYGMVLYNFFIYY